MDGLGDEPEFVKVTITVEREGLPTITHRFPKVVGWSEAVMPWTSWLGNEVAIDFTFAGRAVPTTVGTSVQPIPWLTEAERHHLAYSAMSAAYQETDPRYWNKDPEERAVRRDRWCDIAEQLGRTGSLPRGVHRTL